MELSPRVDKRALRLDPLKRAAPLSLAPKRSERPAFSPLAQTPAPPAKAARKLPTKVTTEKQAPSSQLKMPLHTEPDARKSSPVARDKLICKKRPDSKKAARHKGGSGPKKFVPWC